MNRFRDRPMDIPNYTRQLTTAILDLVQPEVALDFEDNPVNNCIADNILKIFAMWQHYRTKYSKYIVRERFSFIALFSQTDDIAISNVIHICSVNFICCWNSVNNYSQSRIPFLETATKLD